MIIKLHFQVKSEKQSQGTVQSLLNTYESLIVKKAIQNSFEMFSLY